MKPTNDEDYNILCTITGIPQIDKISVNHPEVNTPKEESSGISYDSIIEFLRSLDVKFIDEINQKKKEGKE